MLTQARGLERRDDVSRSCVGFVLCTEIDPVAAANANAALMKQSLFQLCLVWSIMMVVS